MKRGHNRPSSKLSTVPETAPTAKRIAVPFAHRSGELAILRRARDRCRHSATTINSGIAIPAIAKRMWKASEIAICNRAARRSSTARDTRPDPAPVDSVQTERVSVYHLRMANRGGGALISAVVLATSISISGCDCGGSAVACTTSSECESGEICRDSVCVRLPDGAVLDGAVEDGRVAMDGEPPFDGAGRDGDVGDTGVCAEATGEPGRLPVDVIVMVDQSASTGEERDAIQANINTNLGDVLEASGLDYRVILIYGDANALCPAPPLGVAGDCAADNPPRFYRVLQPVNNSDELTLLLWTYDGASRTPNSCHRREGIVAAWRDYLRFESLKVFIVFSDDDPTTFRRSGGPANCPSRPGGAFPGCSNADCLSLTGTSATCGTDCPNFNCPTFATGPADWGGGDFPTELYALEPHRMVGTRMENPFGSPENPRWVFHSLIGVSSLLEPTDPVSDRCAICASGGNTAENAGVTYQALSRLTGGVRFPSCNTDYSPVFTRISSMLAPIACELTLEDTGLGTVDPDCTNVLYYPGGGSTAEAIPRDDGVACDAGANGWQFAGGMTRIRVCGAACARIQADPDARIEIEVGCEPVTCPPDCADGGVVGDAGSCVPEICGNGIDDDCDGLVDELDRDCILF